MRLLGVVSVVAIPVFALMLPADNPAEACGAKISIKGAKLARMRKLQNSSNRAPIAAGPIGIAARGAVNVGGDSATRGAVGHGGGDVHKVPGAKRPKQPKKVVAQQEPKPEPAKEEPAATNPDLGRKTEEPPAKEETQPTPPATEPGEGKVKGHFPDHYFFGNASAQLSASNKTKLKQTARWLKNNPDRSIVVEGHASTNGNLDANRTLSETRADKVKEYLVSLGADESRISVEAFGSDRPEFKPGTSAKNRRVVIVQK
jgi:outer membrane protein OmpA-like peptidoglycan-associated protein